MKLIPLTQGKFAQVDDEDFEYLNQFKWCAERRKHTYYAYRYCVKNGKQTNVRMHSDIMKTPKGMVIDHINKNGLINEKYNLRICTNSENLRNRRGANDNSSSGYIGVSLAKIKSGNKIYEYYFARIYFNKKYKHIGSFKNKKEAVIAYNRAAIEYFGESATLNTEI